MAACLLLGLPGPSHHCRLPARGPRGGTVWSGHPRAAAEAVLALAEALMTGGTAVALVPPLPRPWTRSWPAVAWDASSAQTRDREPALWAAAHPGDEACLALGATPISATDRQQPIPALVAAGHRGDPQRASWAPWTPARLAPLLEPDRIELVPAPDLPGDWCDPGAAARLHLTGPRAGPGIHCFGHHRAHSMPSRYRARRVPPRADAEAQRATARLGGLAPGRGLFVRQLWSAIDRGAEYLDQLATAGPGLSLWHPGVLAELPQVQGAIERELNDHRCRVLDQRRVAVADAVRSGVVAGILAVGDHGLHYAVGGAALRGASGRFLRGLEASGQLAAIHPLPWDTAWFGGGPNRVVLRLDDESALRPPARLDGERLAALRAWVAEHHPQELMPDQVLDERQDERCRVAQAALDRLLPGCLEA